MTAKPPLVSVILPVKNGESTLSLALRSILMQSLADWECLVLDDGSHDSTVAVARSHSDSRIRVLADGRTRGLPERLNQGIARSRAQFVARMDADDVAFPERLERQLSYLLQNPGVDLLGTRVIVFGLAGIPLGTRRAPESHSEICSTRRAGFPIAHPTWVGRKKWFERHRYRARAFRCEDQDLLLRSYRTSKFANLPEPLLGYREESLSLKKILAGRRCMARSVLATHLKEGDRIGAFHAWGGQIARAVLDAVAITTKLDYRVLRHRALPITRADADRWNAVWAHLEAAES